MKLFWTVIFLVFTLASFTQDKEARVKTIDIYYPNYYFFDNYKPHLVSLLPSNLGISYTSMKADNSKGYHIAFDWHEVALIKWAKTIVTPGHIIGRQMLFFSFGLDRNLIKKPKLTVNWLAELNFRGGGEKYWHGIYAGWEPVTTTRTVFDFGASLGSELRYNLPFNFSVAISAKQSIYYFRYYNLFVINFPVPSYDVGTPIANFNFNLKIGYTF